MAETTVEFLGQSFVGESLTEAEERLLYHEVFDYLARGNATLAALFDLNKASIRGAAEVAKAKFKATFAGMKAADNQIAVSLIRPGHILRTTGSTETPLNSWDTEGIQAGAIASGQDNWIGFDTNNATAINIDKELLVLPMGISFTQANQPVVDELQWIVGRDTLPVWVVRNARLADNPNRVRTAAFPPLLLEPKATSRGLTWSETGGRQEMVLNGLSYGLGRLIRSARYTTVAT